jgi:hypothetical protein
MRQRLMHGLALAAMAVLGLGCTDSTDTGGTALYAYDASSGHVLAWDDIAALQAGGSTAITPSRTLSGSILATLQSNGSTLAWGGMAFDSNTSRLYLVSSTGTVVRVESASSANGDISGSQNIVTFYLGQGSDRLSSGTFGQAAVDSTGANLYVTEYNTQSTRVWRVSSPSRVSDGSTITLDDVSVSGDSGGTGVAAGTTGNVYGYFQGGNNLVDPTNISYTGPRLRSGSSGLSNHILIGSNTHLAKYGSLAMDYSNNKLFVAVHTTDAAVSTEPILVFSTGTFTSGWNQSPDMVLSPSGLTNLRILAHPGNKDWLVGAESTGGSPGTGRNLLWIWQSPLNTNSTPTSITLGSGVQILGLALDGSQG